MTKPVLVLASSSPYRRSILERAGFDFQHTSPDIDETQHDGESADKLVRRLALEKAQTVASEYPRALIIGSDQVSECDGRILGKPGNRENAVRQLQFTAGKTAILHTGLALVNSSTGDYQLGVDTYEVECRDLEMTQIEAYVDTERPFDCCGSLKVEGPGIRLLRRLTGNDPNTLMGLPLIMLVDMLRKEKFQGI